MLSRFESCLLRLSVFLFLRKEGETWRSGGDGVGEILSENFWGFAFWGWLDQPYAGGWEETGEEMGE